MPAASRITPKGLNSKWQCTTVPQETIHADFAGPVEGKMFLIVVDAGRTLAGCWQNAGRTLAGRWQDAGRALAEHWQDAGKTLAAVTRKESDGPLVVMWKLHCASCECTSERCGGVSFP